jgi:hypothetical protein
MRNNSKILFLGKFHNLFMRLELGGNNLGKFDGSDGLNSTPNLLLHPAKGGKFEHHLNNDFDNLKPNVIPELIKLPETPISSTHSPSVSVSTSSPVPSPKSDIFPTVPSNTIE